MTMSVNVAHHGPDSYGLKVTIEDYYAGGTQQQIEPPEWRKGESFTLKAGEHRTVYVHSTRRLTVEETPADAVG